MVGHAHHSEMEIMGNGKHVGREHAHYDVPFKITACLNIALFSLKVCDGVIRLRSNFTTQKTTKPTFDLKVWT